jgi:DNA repair exonuclease SbcCD nuclease subunit
MRILHAADLHLAPRLDYIEDRERRTQRREDFARHADQLPTLAREHAVDAILLAGDVFDRDLPALPEVARLAGALEHARVPVFIVPGTHDAYRPKGVWDRPWPANVHVFTNDEWATKTTSDGLAVYGLASRARPLRTAQLFTGLPTKAADAHHHVALVHASLLWPDVKGKVDPKNFPFEEQELANLELDYVALGDHHRLRTIANRAAYPGSPEGLGFDPAEAGPRHMLLVDLGNGTSAPTITPIEVQHRQVVLEQIDLGALEGDSAGDIAETIRRRLNHQADTNRLARFDLTGLLAEPLAIDLDNLVTAAKPSWFHLDVRDRTRTLALAPAESGTIRAAFERRLAHRIASSATEEERALAEQALRLGIQALEGLQL